MKVITARVIVGSERHAPPIQFWQKSTCPVFLGTASVILPHSYGTVLSLTQRTEELPAPPEKLMPVDSL
jgi:hypothetical protein